MPRGGTRKGAGRKSEWPSGCSFENTTVIRIPKNLKEKVVEVAKKLDAGEALDLDTKSESEKVTKSKDLTDRFFDVLNRWVTDANSIKNRNEKWAKAVELLAELADIAEVDFQAWNIDSKATIESVTESEKIEAHPKNELVTNSFEHQQLELLPFSSEQNELVTNSKNIHKTFEPLSNKLLALRLNVTQHFLSKKKGELSSTAFYKLLKDRDPAHIAWKAVGSLKGYSRGYLPSEDTPAEKLTNLREWLDRNEQSKKL